MLRDIEFQSHDVSARATGIPRHGFHSLEKRCKCWTKEANVLFIERAIELNMNAGRVGIAAVRHVSQPGPAAGPLSVDADAAYNLQYDDADSLLQRLLICSIDNA